MFIGLFALALFFRATGLGFVAWDRELVQSPVRFGLSSEGLLVAFQRPDSWDGVIGPMAAIAHMLDFQMFRLDASSQHLTSLWFHVANTILLFAIVKRLVSSWLPAFLASAGFALHPLQTTSVVWLSQRRILLATMFVLVAAYCWLEYRRRLDRRFIAGTSVAGLITALTYPPAALTLLLLPVLAREKQRATSQPGCPKTDEPARIKPDSLRSAGPGNRTWRAENNGRAHQSAAPGTDAACSAGSPLGWVSLTLGIVFGCSALAWGLWKISLPFEGRLLGLGPWELAGVAGTHLIDVLSILFRSAAALATFGTVGPISMLNPADVSIERLGQASAAALVLLVFWAAKKGVARQVLAGLLWFVLVGFVACSFSPENAFAPVQWAYLANAGLFFSAGCCAARLLGVVPRPGAVVGVAMVVVAGMAFCANKQISDWSSSERPLRKSLIENAGKWQSWRFWQCEGVQKMDAGDDVAARSCFRRALAEEFDSRSLAALGFLERRQGRPRQARLTFQDIVTSGQSAALGHTGLGMLSADAGNLAGAAAEYAASLAADPWDAQALAGLAMIRACAPDTALRNGVEALALARRALRVTKSSWTGAMTAAAAAHAELSEYRQAQVMAKMALFWTAHLGDTNEITPCQQRLESYEASKPWRMPMGEAGTNASPGRAGRTAGNPVPIPLL